MANFVEFDSLFNKTVLPEDLGYHIIQLYGFDDIDLEIVIEWISKNLNNNWTTFRFGIPTDGRGFCFLNKEDAAAFKLTWL